MFPRDEILTRLRSQVAAGRPVVGGGAGAGLSAMCATDPFRVMKRFLLDVRDAGFSGVQNFPTVGLIDGTFRQNLEETDMGYDKEVEMIATASDLGLLTCPYVFTPEEAERMAAAGAD